MSFGNPQITEPRYSHPPGFSPSWFFMEARGRDRHGQQNRPGNASEQDKSLPVLLDAREGVRTLLTWDRSNSMPQVMEFGEAKGGLPLGQPPPPLCLTTSLSLGLHQTERIGSRWGFLGNFHLSQFPSCQMTKGNKAHLVKRSNEDNPLCNCELRLLCNSINYDPRKGCSRQGGLGQ